MKNLGRKIRSAWSSLQRGDFVTPFNETMTLLRLHRLFHVGKSFFLTIPPSTEPSSEDAEYPFQLEAATDETVIPRLLKCLEGSDDYSYLSTEEIRTRFAGLIEDGSTAWVVSENDETVAFFWTTPRHYVVPCGARKILLELPDDAAFVEFIFVKASHRRRSVYFRTFKQVARRRPETEFSCVVDSYNTASLGAHRKLGFRPSGSLLYFKLFGVLLASFRFGKTRRRLFRPKSNEPYRIAVR